MVSLIGHFLRRGSQCEGLGSVSMDEFKAIENPLKGMPTGEIEIPINSDKSQNFWRKVLDRKSGRYYYHHTVTNETTWDYNRVVESNRQYAFLQFCWS